MVSIHPGYDGMRMAFDPCNPPSPNPSSHSNREKNTTQVPTERHPTKRLTGTPHDCMGHPR